MKTTKNILLITSEFPPQPGGIGNHAYNLAKGLRERGFGVKVLCDQRSATGEEEKGFDKDLEVDIIRIKREKLIYKSYYQRLQTAKNLAKEADVVLVSGKFPLWVGAYLKKVHAQENIFGIIHGSEVQLSKPSLRKLTDYALKKLDGVIAVSKYTLGLVNNLNLKNTAVIPNGFALENVVKPNETKLDSDKLKLITVGNVTERKGQKNVIQAIPALLKTYPNLEYHIVGIPTTREDLLRLAKKLEIEKHIVFHGKVSDEKKIELLQTSDIFVMLSQATKTGDVEGFGIAILEANALGIPAVGSKNCGIEDAIQTGLSGKLVDPKNSEEVKNAVKEIVSDYQNYSLQAKEWSTNFKWPKIINQYVKFIES